MLRAPRSLVLLSAGCAAAFTAVTAFAYLAPQGRWADAAALDGFRGLPGDGLAWHVARLADPFPFAMLCVALIAAALALRGPRHAAAVTVLLAGASASSQLLKPLLAYPRPFGDWVHAHELPAAALPSGHATAAMSLALAATLVTPLALRALTAAAGAAFALGVSASVVALGWHFPSDVAAAYLLATGWALAVLAGLRAAEAHRPRREREPLSAPSPATIAMAAAGPALLGALLAVPHLDGALEFAREHTMAAATGVAMVIAALALNATLAALWDRRL